MHLETLRLYGADLVLSPAAEGSNGAVRLAQALAAIREAAGESIRHRTGRTVMALIVIAAVVAAGLFAFQFLRTKSKPSAPEKALSAAAGAIPLKSIAVLPFASLSEDKANEYFASGIQDEILTRLAKIADLKVISRTSTRQYQTKPGNLPEIAKQLGVAHILEGSVQKAADQVRVNVQLINALTETHLWADTYDRKLTDIFAVESEIATTIADMLQARLLDEWPDKVPDLSGRTPAPAGHGGPVPDREGEWARGGGGAGSRTLIIRATQASWSSSRRKSARASVR